jgi:hypothetical protein
MSTEYPVWDELGDRDPLCTDRLEVDDPLSAEEAALHIVGEATYDERDQADLLEELADDSNP